MSEARKCDRCKGFFEYNCSKYNCISFGRKTVLSGFKGSPKDICPSCMEQFMKWYENPDIGDANCTDRSNGATEKELELASKLNDAKIYIAQLKSELGYTMTKEEMEFISVEAGYKDPCKSCHNVHCEQCDYGYCSEEEKKNRWLGNHKELKLSDPYEEGGL